MIFEPAYTAGPSFTEPSFTEPPHPEIPSQAPHAPDHAPWMDLSAQISYLGTRMEKLAVVSDTRFYSMENHIDQYQTGFTTQFEHLEQRLGHIEERMDQQHEKMMAYLRSVFPPPSPWHPRDPFFVFGREILGSRGHTHAWHFHIISLVLWICDVIIYDMIFSEFTSFPVEILHVVFII